MSKLKISIIEACHPELEKHLKNNPKFLKLLDIVLCIANTKLLKWGKMLSFNSTCLKKGRGREKGDILSHLSPRVVQGGHR